MKYRIESSGFYDNAERILKHYPCVKDFGYEEEVESNKYRTKHVGYVNIESLEELDRFMTAVDAPIIIMNSNTNEVDHVPSIEIYDSYRE